MILREARTTFFSIKVTAYASRSFIVTESLFEPMPHTALLFKSMFVINSTPTQMPSKFDLYVPKINAEYFLEKKNRCLGPVIWNSFPREIKSIANLPDFKESRKK